MSTHLASPPEAPLPASASDTESSPLLERVVAGSIVAVLTLAGIWVTGAFLSNDFTTSMALTTVFMGGLPLVLWFATARRRDFRVAVIAGYAIVAVVAGGYLARTTLFDTTVNEDVAVGVPASQLAADPNAIEPDAAQVPTPEPTAVAPAAAEEDAAREPEPAKDSELPALSAEEPEPAAEPAASPAPKPKAKPKAKAQPVQLSSGQFSSLSHETSGTASIVQTPDGKTVLTLTDFETDPGPDFKVYLTDKGGQDETGDFIDLGGLKGNKGDQQYVLPENADLGKRTTVLIWCRAFTVGVGQAALKAS